MKNKLTFNILAAVTATVLMAGIQPANASFLQLSHEPLFLNQTVPPAIVVTLDDSGSMKEAYMGSNGDYSFADPRLNRLYYNPNIVYSPPLKADGSSYPQSDYANAWVDGYSNDGDPNRKMKAKIDLENNYIAMDEIIYEQDGYSVTIDFKDTARYNARNGSWKDTYPTGCNRGCSTGTKPYYYTGTAITEITDTDELKNFANWYSYYNSRMKLARAAISRSFAGFNPNFKIAWQELNRNDDFTTLGKFENTHRDDFFNWLFGVPTNGGTPLRQAFVRATEVFEDDDSYKSDDYAGLLSCQQNFHIAISDGGWGYDDGSDLASASLRDENAMAIVGDTGNPSNNNQPMYASAGMNYTGAGKQAIYKESDKITAYNENSNLVQRQKTLADITFDSWIRDLRPGIDNYVPRFKKDYTNHDGVDITFTNVTDEWENAEFVWNPKNDPAYWQHLVTYNVGLGLNASLVEDHANGNTATCDTAGITDSKDAVYQSLRAKSPNSCVWPNDLIDDVWHSSINSRGDFFSANDPEELIEALTEVVNSISERTARGSTSTVSSGIVTDDTLAYTPKFDSSTWSGTVVGREVNDDNTFGDVTWDAGCVLTGGTCASTGETVPKQTNRSLYTYDKNSKTRYRFDTSLPSILRAILNLNLSDLLGSLFGGLLGIGTQETNEVIEYVLGDQDNEQSGGGQFRDRVSVMADVVHSSPVIVRGPGEGYDDEYWPDGTAESDAADNDNGYFDFKIAHKDRENIVYIGSNGGMLHAFATQGANEGQEIWGYMPSKAFENIHHLPTNKHHSYVDNTPVTQDAFIDGQWKTVLVGGMRYGGQAFFALDITDASADKPTVLWEFTDKDDADMGYSYGKAAIVRLGSTGEWAALLPNGYNNSQPDYSDETDPRNRTSQTGTAVMYVVRLSDGSIIHKFDTGVGDKDTPNGLATPMAVDSEFVEITGGTEKKVDIGADYAYAGDLYGNLWRFDMTDTSPGNWTMKKVVAATNNMDRPITVRPRVVNIPNDKQNSADDVMVTFGTGKYIEIPDRDINLPADQYIVGVIDGLDSTDDNLNILDNGFVEQSFSDGTTFRDLTQNHVDHNNDLGWRIKLPDTGERVFNPMAMFGTGTGSDVLMVTSNVTAGVDPCLPGGKSWLLALDPLTGGLPSVGHIFRNIKVLINGVPTAIAGSGTGISINDFIIGEPPILENQGGGSASIVIEGVDTTQIITIQKFTWRRRNWTNLLTQ